MLKTRFTAERSNNLSNLLTSLTVFKFTAKESEAHDYKGFVDRFKQAIGDVRAIDPAQVPAEEMLKTFFLSALQEQDKWLWGLIKLDKKMTLEDMLSLTAEWTNKESNSTPKSNAVANYSALPGNLKKAYGRKQKSGRSSGKDKVFRAVEKERCFACNRPGHKVRQEGQRCMDC